MPSASVAPRRSGTVVLAAALLVVVTACAGPGPTPVPRAPSPAPSDAAGLASEPAPETAAPAATWSGDGPPGARLTGPGSAAVAGELGSWTWHGEGSDAPWLVPPRQEAVRGPGPYTVVPDPELPIERWTAAWAPVLADGTAGMPAGGTTGAAGPIRAGGPPGPGAWSLAVTAAFSGGGRAAWYWRIEALP